MSTPSWTSSAWFALVVTCCGCSGSGVVPVTGKVVFGNREIPAVCRLTFVPVEDGSTEGGIRPNGATMQADGTYRMTPYQGVEGLVPGRYTVRVSYFDLKPGGDPQRENDWIEHKFEADELVIEAGSRAVEYDVQVP